MPLPSITLALIKAKANGDSALEDRLIKAVTRLWIALRRALRRAQGRIDWREEVRAHRREFKRDRGW